MKSKLKRRIGSSSKGFAMLLLVFFFGFKETKAQREIFPWEPEFDSSYIKNESMYGSVPIWREAGILNQLYSKVCKEKSIKKIVKIQNSAYGGLSLDTFIYENGYLISQISTREDKEECDTTFKFFDYKLENRKLIVSCTTKKYFTPKRYYNQTFYNKSTSYSKRIFNEKNLIEEYYTGSNDFLKKSKDLINEMTLFSYDTLDRLIQVDHKHRYSFMDSFRLYANDFINYSNRSIIDDSFLFYVKVPKQRKDASSKIKPYIPYSEWKLRRVSCLDTILSRIDKKTLKRDSSLQWFVNLMKNIGNGEKENIMQRTYQRYEDNGSIVKSSVIHFSEFYVKNYENHIAHISIPMPKNNKLFNAIDLQYDEYWNCRVFLYPKYNLLNNFLYHFEAGSNMSKKNKLSSCNYTMGYYSIKEYKYYEHIRLESQSYLNNNKPKYFKNKFNNKSNIRFYDGLIFNFHTNEENINYKYTFK